MCFRLNLCNCGCVCRTLVIGGIGSLMLDLYGWESVFYVSGLLSVLWAYCMWKYLLKGEGMYRISTLFFPIRVVMAICKMNVSGFWCHPLPAIFSYTNLPVLLLDIANWFVSPYYFLCIILIMNTLACSAISFTTYIYFSVN